MERDSLEAETAFKDSDHLQLLQLLTRRAIWERRVKTATQANLRTASVQGEESVPSGTSLPRLWQLVPSDVSLHDWQRECLALWLKQKRGTVKVATGGGKTLFALAVAQELQNTLVPDLRVVIVVPTIPLMFQWRDEVQKGNLPASAIALMGGGQEPSPDLSGIRILICVLNSARERLPALLDSAGWGGTLLLVVDECHRTAAEQARRIFEAKPQYTLGLSATPETDSDRNDLPPDEAYNKGIVGQSLGPIIYDFSLKRSLEAGLLTPFEVWHIGLPLSPSETIEHARFSREIADLRKALLSRYNKSKSRQPFLAWCQTQASRGSATQAEAERFINLSNLRKRLLYRAKTRREITLNILNESLSESDGRAIIFHESIEEIESLFLEILGQGMPAVLEHSKLPDSLRAENIEAFRKGLARVIVSAKSLVEGFNAPSANVGIIAASSSSVRQRIQSLGRMLRRKPRVGQAKIFVLYVRDTEDEAIYERADWENVIGAERNRYFQWQPLDEHQSWGERLEEINQPPRRYRPPSWQVDVKTLEPGDLYPGQSQGREVRVDQDGNLRAEDDGIISIPQTLIQSIIQHNPSRRAQITPAGHLIVWADSDETDEPGWRFLGVVHELPDTNADNKNKIRLKIMTASGKRRIALEGERKGIIRFALGSDRSTSPEAGETRDQLLEWIQENEAHIGQAIHYLYWDGGKEYWLEVQGEKIPFHKHLSSLEFSQ